MKKFFSKALAMSMVGTMVLSVNVSASSGDLTTTASANLELTSTLTSPAYMVVVPTATNFAINPLKIGTDIDTQLYSDPVVIVNKSNVPVEMSVTVKPTLASTSPKPAIKLEDEVLAASAVMTDANKYASLYIAPTTKIDLATGGVTLDTTTTTYAKPTQYIGVGTGVTGTTAGTFTTVLGVSPQYVHGTTPTWAAPTTLTDTKTAVAFKILGSVNKNAAWLVGDIKVTATWQFMGMDTDMYDDTILLSTYANVTKFTHGTGSVVDTPRFRNKTATVDLSDLTAGGEQIALLELGSTAAAAYKASSTVLTPTLSAITLTNNGVADTTTFKATDFTVAIVASDDATLGAEAGLIATVTLSEAAAKKLVSGNVYAITGFTLKMGTPTYVAGTGAGVTINPINAVPATP